MQLLLVVCFCNFFCFVFYCPNQAVCDFWLSWKNVRICNDTCWVGWTRVWSMLWFFFRSHKPELVYNQWYYSLSLSHSLTCIIFQGHSNVKQLKFYVIWFRSDFDCQLHHLIIFHGHIYSREIIDCPNLTKSLTLVLLSTLLSKVFQT